MKRTIALILLVLLLAFLLAQTAHAQGPIVPTPPPPVTPPPDPLGAAKQIDAANARADQWRSVATQAVNNAQSSINYAYGALADAQAGLYQAQVAFQQEHAMLIASQQGQIQQAVTSAQAAQLSASSAIALVSRSTDSSLASMKFSSTALRDVAELKAALMTITAQRDAARSESAQFEKDRAALAGALVAERQRSDLIGRVSLAGIVLALAGLVYMAIVLWRITRPIKPAPDRVVVINERGQVQAQIETLN